MKHGKKFLSLALALILVLGLLPMNALAATYSRTINVKFEGAKTGSGSSYKWTYTSPNAQLAVKTVGDARCPSGYSITGYKVNGSTKSDSYTWKAANYDTVTLVLKSSSSSGSGSGSGSGSVSGSHGFTAKFKVLYVDSSFNVGYNYGDEFYTTTVSCQYSAGCSSTNVATNHTIALTDIGNARSHLSVNSGWEIVGWTKTASKDPSISTSWSGTGIGSGSTTLMNNGTIYLVAKKASTAYTISYYANGGSGAPSATQTASTTSSPKTGTLSNTTPTWSGHTFLGWSTSSTATTAAYAAGGTYNFSGNTTLYAVWESATAAYTVEWKDTDGNTLKAPETRSGTVGETVRATSEDIAVNGYTYKEGLSTATTTLAASGTKLVLYFAKNLTVKWVDAEGSTLKSIDIPEGEDYREKAPTAPSATGHWKDPVTDGNGNITIQWEEPPKAPAKPTTEELFRTTFTLQCNDLDKHRTTMHLVAQGSNGIYNEWNSAWCTYPDAVEKTGDTYTWTATLHASYWVNWYRGHDLAVDQAEDVPVVFTWDASSETWVCSDEPVIHMQGKKQTYIWYDEDGETELDKQTVSKCLNAPAYSKATPTKAEDENNTYTFKEWSGPVTDDGNKVYTATYTPTPKQITVTWLNGYSDTSIKADTVDKGTDPKTLEYPADPTREGYHFAGWGEPDVNETTGNITITATWEENPGPGPGPDEPDPPQTTYAVTWYDADGTTVLGTGTTEDPGTLPAAPAIPAAPEGKEFDRWGDPVIDADAKTISITLVWKDKEDPGPDEPDPPQPEQVTITLTYTAGEGSGDDVTASRIVDEGESAAFTVLDSPFFAPEGMIFDGWLGSDGETYAVGADIEISADLTLTAQWVEDQTGPVGPDDPQPTVYTVTYLPDADSEDGVTVAHVVPEDETTAEHTVRTNIFAIPAGKVFAGWRDSEGNTHQPGDKLVLEGDETLVVVWEDEEIVPPVTYYTVTYVDGVNGNAFAAQSHSVESGGATPGFAGTPTRTGYAFTGWSPAVTPTVTGDVTYTAQWRYIDNGGGYIPVVPDTPDDVVIDDEEVPLAAAPGLNATDHFAYIVGYEDGTVRPTGYITRAEVATIFFRLMTDEYRTANWSTTNSFSDVERGAWYNNAVSTAVRAGLLKGYTDGSFGGGRSITRAEFAAIAARFLSDEAVTAQPFADTVGHWAEQDILRAVQAGWILGDGDGNFRPNDPITRAEAMTLVNRMLDRVPDKAHMHADMITWPDNPESAWYYEAVQEATNGHDYERADGVTETWTALQPARDWVALERGWADGSGTV